MKRNTSSNARRALTHAAQLIAAAYIAAGCSTILGFEEGTPRESDAGSAGSLPTDGGPQEASVGGSGNTGGTLNDGGTDTGGNGGGGFGGGGDAGGGNAGRNGGNSGEGNDAGGAGGCTCTDDGDPCTDDVCSGSSCTHPNNGNCVPEAGPSDSGSLCAVNQRVVNHACVACPAGSTNAAGNDASGADTACDATLCAVNQRVVSHACVACSAGSTNAVGDDASGADTACDATLCAVNQRVVSHACVACPAGSTNAAGDDATGADTTCDATLCAVNQRVLSHACVACPARSTNAEGDNATGLDTSCDGPNCAGLPANCGPAGNEDCCTSPLVTGGTFYRSYDGVMYTDQSYPATVSGFRLDRFDVTVGRFRSFKAAWDSGWRPAQGDGKHTHLNGGLGLAATAGGNEPGWDTSWASLVAPTNANLACGAPYHTWTPTAGANETQPINCVNWYDLYAFCIWDGGFLPSEAEWNYAASGGSEQRVYPWSSPATSTVIGCSYANYLGCGVTNKVGTESPKGDGKWGQADLSGNVWEWNLDWPASYAPGCNNCANFTDASSRGIRGGSFTNGEPAPRSAFRYSIPTNERGNTVGPRCARIP